MNHEMYRVLPRVRAMAIGIAIVAAATIGAWFAIRWMQESSTEFERLLEQTPEQAALEIVHRLRLYAWLYGGSLLAMAAWIAWMAARIIRTQRLPPPGSWIIEGQRTWEGDAAVKRGKILQIVSVVLALAACGLFAMLWKLAGTIRVPGA
jgi:hypothetical protein